MEHSGPVQACNMDCFTYNEFVKEVKLRIGQNLVTVTSFKVKANAIVFTLYKIIRFQLSRYAVMHFILLTFNSYVLVRMRACVCVCVCVHACAFVFARTLNALIRSPVSIILNCILDSKYLLYSKPYGSLDKSLSPSRRELLAQFVRSSPK